jgi:hypothetical protein
MLYNEFLTRFKDSNYILTTLLRDPVERWLSHYFWRVYFPSAYKAYDHKKQAGELIIPGMIEPLQVPEGQFTVEAALRDAKTPWAKSLGRLQSRFLGGYIDENSDDPSAIVERAKRNLDEFDIVGTLEQFDRFSSQFKSTTGDNLTLPHANKSETPKDFQLLKSSSELRAIVADICAPDIELYEYALTKT